MAIETVLPFKLILNVVRSGVSEFDTSLMTWFWNKEESLNSELSVDVRFGAYSGLRSDIALGQKGPRLCENALFKVIRAIRFPNFAGHLMKRFVEGLGRGQSTLFPASLDDYVTEDNPVRAVDVFVDGLDLDRLGFVGVQPLDTGRPSYHPGVMLKLYIYGYLNRVPSSRRLERECQRNIEMIWLTGQLAPDFKTIADFRKDNGRAIREVCREFVALCRKLDLLSAASVAIDGSKFKAVNARDKNFTEAKMKRRLERINESVACYLSQLETADRHGDAVPEAKVARLKSKIEKLKEEERGQADLADRS